MSLENRLHLLMEQAYLRQGLADLREHDRRLIQQAACRRLEAATGGRLTFAGDEIVRVGDGVERVFRPAAGGGDRGGCGAEAR